jgi:hypothetical protein
MRATNIDVEPLEALQIAVSEIRDRAAELDQQLEDLCRHVRRDQLANAGELAEDLVDEVMRWAHVVFQPPDDDERMLLWERLLAADGAPLAHDIRYDALSTQFPKMTGANIRNAALAAAFLAAAEEKDSISEDVVMRAARGEYQAMGHLLAASGLRSR